MMIRYTHLCWNDQAKFVTAIPATPSTQADQHPGVKKFSPTVCRMMHCAIECLWWALSAGHGVLEFNDSSARFSESKKGVSVF